MKNPLVLPLDLHLGPSKIACDPDSVRTGPISIAWFRFGSVLGPFWVRFGSVLGSFWFVLDPFWVRFGSVLGPRWLHFGFVPVRPGSVSFSFASSRFRFRFGSVSLSFSRRFRFVSFPFGSVRFGAVRSDSVCFGSNLRLRNVCSKALIRAVWGSKK